MKDQNFPVLIRKATQHDIPVIRDIALSTWPQAYKNILTRDALDYMLNQFYSNEALAKQMEEGQEFFIAEVNEIVVGFSSISEWKHGAYKLNKLYVLPQFQNTGTGKKLMKDAISRVNNLRAKAFILNVNRKNPAIDFYRKLGFEIIAEENVYIGNGYYQEDYVMGIQLKN